MANDRRGIALAIDQQDHLLTAREGCGHRFPQRLAENAVVALPALLCHINEPHFWQRSLTDAVWQIVDAAFFLHHFIEGVDRRRCTAEKEQRLISLREVFGNADRVIAWIGLALLVA